MEVDHDPIVPHNPQDLVDSASYEMITLLDPVASVSYQTPLNPIASTSSVFRITHRDPIAPSNVREASHTTVAAAIVRERTLLTYQRGIRLVFSVTP